MTNLENVIQKSIELNNAIYKLQNETKVIDKIVSEKRNGRLSNMLKDLKPYCEAMERLDVGDIYFTAGSFMQYPNGSTKEMGIRIKKRVFRGDVVFQIDLGVYSNVSTGFYACHSLGAVSSGAVCEKILHEFLDKWHSISLSVESGFVNSLNKMLEERKTKATQDRDVAINTLTKTMK